MKRRDVFVLNWLFASLYFPTSMILWWLNQKGTFFGVLIVGLVFHIILTVLLVVTLWTEERKSTRVEIVPPKRAYKRKNKQEVKYDEQKTEVEPTVRTDVDLNQLDADDDDVSD